MQKPADRPVTGACEEAAVRTTACFYSIILVFAVLYVSALVFGMVFPEIGRVPPAAEAYAGV